MLHAKNPTRRSTRRAGAVLLVVLAMLALFAIVGLSFVFYAESRATSSRIYREGQTLNEPDTPDAQQAALDLYAQLIYDAPDRTGVFSGLRGHSLARAMYGYYYETPPPQGGVYDLDNSINLFTTNSLAYNGVGPVPDHVLPPGPPSPATPGQTPIVNYMWQNGQPLIDPERTGQRLNPLQRFADNSRYISKAISSTYPDANDMAVAMVNPVNGQVVAPSMHRAWLFNNQFANDINEHRRQLALAPPVVLGGPPTKPVSLDGTGDDWTNANGRYRIIRPRPFDHGGLMSQFPYPPKNADGTFTGDVQNLPGAVYPYLNQANGSVLTDATGNPILIPKNDSVWIDIGAPVRIWNGKRIKPLFAFLVNPTNNKVNVNASGNLRGLTPGTPPSVQAVHTSGMGLNASEINLSRVLRQNSGTIIQEYERLKFNQYGATQPTYTAGGPLTAAGASLPNPPGRTQQTTLFNATLPPSAYAPFDWDGGAPFGAMRLQLPGQQGAFVGQTNGAPITLGNSAFAMAPRWVAPLGFSRYGNGDLGEPLTATTPGEQLNSPYLWNPYLWRSAGTLGKVFSDSDIRKLHAKWSDDTGVSNDTQIGQLAPFSFGSIRGIPGLSSAPGKSENNAHRFSITNRSNGLAIHNLMPMSVNLGVGGNSPSYTTPLPYTWILGRPVPEGVGGANGAGPFPDPTAGGYGPQTTTDFDYSQLNNAGGAGALTLIRGVTSNLPPLDLNRPLADYRHRLAVAFAQNRIPLALSPTNMILPLNTAAEYSAWLRANNLADAAGNPLPGVPAYGGTIVYNGTTVTIQNLLAQSAAEQQLSLFTAMRDRQELAKDIFARLVIATGAAGSYMKWNGYMQALVPPTVAPGNTPNPQYDALRYLAQLSANIVDYIDGDDVATTFVWNPVNPNVQSLFYLDPLNPGLLSPVGTPPAADNFSAVNVPDRLVMGTEKPKLVVNEAYSELANNYRDATAATAGQRLELRFILELMNPNANDLTRGTEAKPFGTPTQPITNPMQNAPLFYESVDQTVSRDWGLYSTYLVDIHRNGSTEMQNLAVRNNVLGLPLALPDLRVDFAAIRFATDPANTPVVGPTVTLSSGYAGANVKNQSQNGTMPKQVGPVGAKYRPDVWTDFTKNPVNQGYLVLAPAQTPMVAQEFNPYPWDEMAMPSPRYNVAPNTPHEYTTMVPRPYPGGDPTNTLALEVGPAVPREADILNELNTIRAAQPAIVLRRLANPYLPPNDPTITTGKNAYRPTEAPNPYLAVDRMENVAVNDGVRVGADSNATTERPNNGGSVYPTPLNERKSWTKAHPTASNVAYSQAMTVAPAPMSSPHEALYRHNYQNTMTEPEVTTAGGGPNPYETASRLPVTADPMLFMTPQGGGRNGFEWLVHLDRPLVNQLELLHVPAVPTHQLTHQFVSGPPTQPVLHSHVAAWTDKQFLNPASPMPPTITVSGNQTRLYRALELLKVKPWSYAMPIGGRVPGKININMVSDPNVLLALADPQSGDFFSAYTGTVDTATGQTFDALVKPSTMTDTPVTVIPPQPNSADPLLSIFDRMQLVRGGITNPPGQNTPTFSAQYDPATNTLRQVQVPGPFDRPFRSLGNAYTTAGTAPFTMPAKNGLAETALNGVFDLRNQTHPYVKQSLTRKMYNNLTTTSECFEVYLTVGFFEVLNPGPYYTAPNWTTPMLGKEVYKDNPGDLRARFFAIVDRTNLSIQPEVMGVTPIGPITRKQGPKPVFTELASPLTTPAIPANTGVPNPAQYTLQVQAQAGDSTGLTLNYDEATDQTTSYRITPGTYLRIGSGLNAEWVQVQSIGTRINISGTPTPVYHDSVTGIGYLNVIRNTGYPTGLNLPVPTDPRNWYQPPLVIGLPPSDGLTLPVHPVGSLVTNAQLGNPGPQPNFDPSQPNYKAVMPYMQRLED